MNTGIKRSADLVMLSDAFRRHAAFEKPDDVARLVDASRQFLNLISYYEPSLPDDRQSRGLVGQLRGKVAEIAFLSRYRLGLDEIVLPLDGHRQNAYAGFVRRQVLKGLDVPVKIKLQAEAYTADLSALGTPDPAVKTVLDYGIRGFLRQVTI